MADNRQLSIAFKNGGIKDLPASVESLQKIISATITEAEKLKKKTLSKTL